MPDQIVIEPGDLRRYRTEIPNLIDDWGLSVYARALYHHYKRSGGDSGACRQGMRAIAAITGMSIAQVSRARQELVSQRLITIEPAASREACEIVRIADIWTLNYRSYGPHADLTPAAAIALITGKSAQPTAAPKVLLPETPPPPEAPEGVTTRNTPPAKQAEGVTGSNRGVSTRNRGVTGRNTGSNSLGKNTLRKEQEEEGEVEDLSARAHTCETLPPPPPSGFDKANSSDLDHPEGNEGAAEARVHLLAAAIAETCGLNLALLATLPNGKAAKHAEIIDYARRLADLTIPAHWCEDDSMAGPITPAYIDAFLGYWQSARPVGNAKDDLPHPVQVYERICTRDAMRHITANLAAQRRYSDRENAVTLGAPRPAGEPAPAAPDEPPADPEAARLWSTVLSELSLSLQHSVYDNYLRPTRAAAFRDGVFTITAPNPFIQEWVSVRMAGMIENRLQTLAGTGPISLHVRLAA